MKKFDGKKEQLKWTRGDFPYEFMSCGQCLAMHGRNDTDFRSCRLEEEHAVLRTELRKAGLERFGEGPLAKKDVTAFLKIRKQFPQFFGGK